MVIFTSGFIDSISITTSNSKNDLIEIEDVNGNKEVSLSNDENVLNLLILGDSIGSGAGDEAGKDIGRRYGELLDENNEINAINLSISGSKSEDLLEIFNDEDYDEILRNSDLIIVSIGGNDLKEILDSSALDLFVDYDNILLEFLNNLESIIGALREKNNVSQIVCIGLYNPYGETLSEEKLDLLMHWNYETQRLIESYDQTVYIPTQDLFKYNLESYLSIDAFHPSAKGYDAITKRLYNVINGVE
jgi:lysophospholipase L1-like esterase